jgi:O-antigen/teichoic acid export membrane protein
MTSRTLKTNFAINVIGSTIPLAVALVTVPIYVRHIGDARYGVLSIVWVLLGYFGFLDLGLSRSAVNALARLRNAPQQARAQVLVTTMTINLGLGILGSLCLAIFGSYLLQHLLSVPDALRPEIASSFPWIVSLLPLALVSGVGIGALESRENFLLVNLLQVSGGSLGQIVPVILAVLISPTLPVVIPATVAARALTAAAILIVVYRAEGPLSIRAFDITQARKLLSYGSWVSVSSVISPILTTLDQFVIGSVLNVAAVTYYAVPMNLVLRSQIFAAALSRTLFPRMSSVGHQHALGLASRALFSLAYGYAAICAPAMVITPVFFRYWISADFSAAAAPVADLLFLGAWINGLAFVSYELLQSQGRPDITGKLHAAEVLPFVGILWFLTSTYGIIGAAIAWSLRCAADAACLMWIAGIPRSILVKAIMPPAALLAGSYVITRWLGDALWLDLLVAAIVATLGLTLALVASKEIRYALSTAVSRSRLVQTMFF